MIPLQEALQKVSERIVRYRDSGTNEQNTKAALIEPILRALGWDVEDLDEVQREFKPKSADNPVDYALLVLRAPRLFVEAKALGENLDDRKWASQIMGYAGVAGVEWVVLTNGNEYRVYNAHAPVPVEEKMFRAVRVTDDRSEVAHTRMLLSKEQMQENHIEVLWKAHFVDRQVREAIGRLFATEPDPSLINLIRRRLPSLSPHDIKASLNRVRVRFDFPAELSTDPLPAARHAATINTSMRHPDASASHLRQKPHQQSHKREGIGVSLQDLIRAGFIIPPLTLEATFKHQQLHGCIEANGSVTWRGHAYTSLSTAGGFARASVSGREYESVDGWVFWRFKDADGQIKPNQF